MRINVFNPEFMRPDQIRSGGTAGGDPVNSGKLAQPVEPIGRPDKVEISSAGRALKANEEPEAELSPERIAEIRQRIHDRAYDTLEMVDEVARRILASGEL